MNTSTATAATGTDAGARPKLRLPWPMLLGPLAMADALRLDGQIVERRVAESYPVDFNGRRIAADWGTLGHARFVRVELAGAEKHYRAVDRLDALDAANDRVSVRDEAPAA
jgi:hypothetical protein